MNIPYAWLTLGEVIRDYERSGTVWACDADTKTAKEEDEE